ncbi:dicarboxylate/amino acid:cation symporter [Emcibacter sp. SYSU 3D8]|uniref:dicarboxylate/amino acid:cation symporter n=1 Tax=Emcibacter sp. SYSU 3D8 TaxID=3133969 RepID=UPI0031FE9D37
MPEPDDDRRRSRQEQAFAVLYPHSLKYLSESLHVLVKGRLWLQVIVGMVLGLATGMALGPSTGWVDHDLSTRITNWLAFPGQLFLALIQMIVIPLVFASIIRGLSASENLDQLRRMGSIVVVYFVATTAVAITIGLWLALLIEPGRYVPGDALLQSFNIDAAAQTSGTRTPAFDSLPEKIITLLPSNPLTSMVESNMLQVVMFSAIVGAALVIMSPRQSRPLLELLGSVQEVCMTVVRWAMMLAPLAVFGLLAQLTAQIGLDALAGMAVYVGVVLLGLFLLLCMYLAIVFLGARMHPLRFLRDIREVMLLAFSTSSSAAVMPLSIRTAEERLGVRPSVSQFVIPVGATLNMNGTALYQGVATIFLAQVFGVEIGFSGLLLIVVTAVGASIGSPATPGVGIVILSMVLTSVGIPPAGIALIIGVDRILDMSRTAINVSGDLVACVLMNRWVGGENTPEEIAGLEAAAVRQKAETGENVTLEQGKGSGG